MSPLRAWCAIAIGCAAAAGCGAPSTRSRAAGDAIVEVTSNVREARLFVDGRFIAPVAALRGGIAIDPGAHRLELRHESYFSRYLELQVARGERRSVVLDLVPVLP